MNNDERLKFTCECCFEPVTPLTIKEHHCDPEIRARREREREEVNKEINEIQEMLGSEDYDYAFKGMSNEEIIESMADDVI